MLSFSDRSSTRRILKLLEADLATLAREYDSRDRMPKIKHFDVDDVPFQSCHIHIKAFIPLNVLSEQNNLTVQAVMVAKSEGSLTCLVSIVRLTALPESALRLFWKRHAKGIHLLLKNAQ